MLLCSCDEHKHHKGGLYLAYMLGSQFILEESQEGNKAAGTLEEHCSLACSPEFAQLVCLQAYTAWTSCLQKTPSTEGGTAHINH